MDELGQGLISKCLLHLDGLPGIEEFVDVRRHGGRNSRMQLWRYALR